MSAEGWMPVRISNDGTGVVDWVYTSGFAFDEPFFDETVERALRNPFRLLVRRTCPLREVESTAGRRARDPDGLIFHVSRCGSTFLASALRAREGTQVLSEPGPVDTVLATVTDHDAAVDALRQVIRAMAPDDPGRAHVVKLDAWSTLELPLLLAAFPSVPWVLLHRDPAEVLVSLQQRRGFHVIPGALDPGRLGLTMEEVGRMGLDEYAAMVLGRIMTTAAEVANSMGDRLLVLEHQDLSHPGVELAAAHFGLPMTDADSRNVAEVAKVHAKNPVLPWSPDTEIKQRAVTPALRRLATHEAGAAYDALQSLGQGCHEPV